MKERTCLYVLVLVTVLALLGTHQLFAQQTMPVYLSRSPEYWWGLYQSEHTRADGLATEGSKAISGLQDALQAANDTIAVQNQTIKRVTRSYDIEKSRADKSEIRLEDCEGKQPKTWAGRKLQQVGRTARDALAVVGAVTVTVLTVKLVL
ncbi:hypothetical protein [Spirosoma fluminis]